MKKECINKQPAGIVSERQTREETVMFPDANNHFLPDTRKGNRYSLGTGNRTRQHICTLKCRNTLSFFFKFVRRLRATFFVVLMDTLISVKTRCVLSASACQYPLMIFVINCMYLIHEYTVLIGDPIAV